jgi:hypothetical protein
MLGMSSDRVGQRRVTGRKDRGVVDERAEQHWHLC